MEERKILLFDIETTSLFSSIGSIVCIGIFDPKIFEEPTLYFVSNPEEETKALKWLKDQIIKNNYNSICGWNLKGFDVPFLIGRAVKLGFDFSEIAKLEVIDLLEIVRNKVKLHSYKMEDVCRWLDIPFNREVKNYKIDELYHRFLSGDMTAKEKIKKRCKTDLIGLAKLLEKFENYLNLMTTNKCAFS